MPVYFNNVEAIRPAGKNRTEFTIRYDFYLSDKLVDEQPEVAMQIAKKYGTDPIYAMQAVETLKKHSGDYDGFIKSSN